MNHNEAYQLGIAYAVKMAGMLLPTAALGAAGAGVGALVSPEDRLQGALYGGATGAGIGAFGSGTAMLSGAVRDIGSLRRAQAILLHHLPPKARLRALRVRVVR